MATKSTQRIIELLVSTLFFITIPIAWELSVWFFSIPHYLLPPPSIIALSFAKNFNLLLFHAGVTLTEAFFGFLCANILGVLVAIAFSHSRTLAKSLYPFVIALKTTPLIAVAPLLILWFGNGIFSKIAAAALISFFPIIVNTVKGLESIDAEALDFLKSISASQWQIFTKLRFPTALPSIFSALKISSSLSVVGAIVGEFIGADKGIGFVILISSYHLETAEMFSAVIAAALIGIIFFLAVSLIERKVIFWNSPEE